MSSFRLAELHAPAAFDGWLGPIDKSVMGWPGDTPTAVPGLVAGLVPALSSAVVLPTPAAAKKLVRSKTLVDVNRRRIFASMSSSTVVVPGEAVLKVPESGTLRLGPGLITHEGSVVATKCGVLKQTKTGNVWLEGRQKR